jgi:hypothetical protein
MFNTSRLDQFRSRMVFPLLGRLVADRHGECCAWPGGILFEAHDGLKTRVTPVARNLRPGSGQNVNLRARRHANVLPR